MWHKLIAFSVCLSILLNPNFGAFAQTERECVPASPATLPFASDQLIVKLRPEIKVEKGNISTYNVSLVNTLATIDAIEFEPIIGLKATYILKLEKGTDVSKAVIALNNDPAVEYAEPDYLAFFSSVPNDTQYSEQWGLSKISIESAWDKTTGTPNVVIAVIDSGLHLAHEDLTSNLWNNPGEIPSNGLDDDNNGFIDDITGWNFVDSTNNVQDYIGHGSLVTGVAAARINNALGIAGVCGNCGIMPIKVSNTSGSANYSDIAAGVYYATQKGARVINISLGGYANSITLNNAVDFAVAQNTVVVAAAGNDNSSSLFYPAAYENVIAVAGTDQTDHKTASSNFGAWVDLSAPGQEILSTASNGGYGLGQGTSYAAPFVSGAAGLLLTLHPEWTPAEIISKLRETSENLDSLNPNYAGLLGTGRLNFASNLKPWTFMVFTAADNTEETPAETESLYNHWKDMYDDLPFASRNNNVNLVGFWDDNDSFPHYDAFVGGQTISFPQSVELDTGDPETLRGFIDWTVERYPAEHYVLMIASHGSGVLGTALDYQNDPMPNPEARSILTPLEMRQAVNGLPFIDIVYLDGCLMASIEISNDLADHAGYLVASEALIMLGDTNFIEPPYTRIDRIINGYENTGSAPVSYTTTPLDLASSIARLHEDTYKVPHALWNVIGGTISVIDLSKVRTVVDYLDQLSTLLILRIGSAKQVLNSIYQDVQRYDEDGMADLYHFAYLVKERFSDPEIQASAQLLMDSILNSVDTDLNFHWGGWETPVGYRSYADSHGLSIYYPDPNATHSDYSGLRISLSEGTNWFQNPIFIKRSGIDEIEHIWGPFLVAYTYATNPSPPDEPFPPASTPIFVPYFLSNLPLILR